MEAETAFFGQIKYLNLVKVHIESVPSKRLLDQNSPKKYYMPWAITKRMPEMERAYQK